MLQKYNGINWVNNYLCYNLWIVFFSLLPVSIRSNNAKFNDKIAGEDPEVPKKSQYWKKVYLYDYNYFNYFCRYILYGH